MGKIFVCDYFDFQNDVMDFFIIEAENEDSALTECFNHLKSLGIPRRYFVSMEEF